MSKNRAHCQIHPAGQFSFVTLTCSTPTTELFILSSLVVLHVASYPGVHACACTIPIRRMNRLSCILLTHREERSHGPDYFIILGGGGTTQNGCLGNLKAGFGDISYISNGSILTCRCSIASHAHHQSSTRPQLTGLYSQASCSRLRFPNPECEYA